MLNPPSMQELRAKYILPVCLGRVFNHFTFVPSFSLWVYLVLGESKIEKQFSSQINLH